MISACLSIVQDSYSKLFSAAVINFSRQIIACQSFLLDGKSLDPEDRYGDIWAFLASELSDPNTTQVIIAVPYVWHVVRVEGIPVLALEKSSIYLKILHYLSENR